MHHVTEELAARIARGDASPEEEASARAHAESCPRCRALLAETRAVWAAMEADPAALLADTPLWPRVAEALDGERGTADAPVPVLRPRWKDALAEAWRRPLAYAAVLLALAGVVGGEMAGRTLLGGSSPRAVSEQAAATEIASPDEDLLAYTALADFPEGSLASLYLGDELHAGESAGEGWGESRAPIGNTGSRATPDGTAGEGDR